VAAIGVFVTCPHLPRLVPAITIESRPGET
jgi:hypothetical protein